MAAASAGAAAGCPLLYQHAIANPLHSRISPRKFAPETYSNAPPLGILKPAAARQASPTYKAGTCKAGTCKAGTCKAGACKAGACKAGAGPGSARTVQPAAAAAAAFLFLLGGGRCGLRGGGPVALEAVGAEGAQAGVCVGVDRRAEEEEPDAWAVPQTEVIRAITLEDSPCLLHGL